MSITFDRREYDVYAPFRRPHPMFDRLVTWLRRAGLQVLSEKLEPGSPRDIEQELHLACDRSRSLLVVARDSTLDEWNQLLIDIAAEAREREPRFRTIALKHGDGELPVDQAAWFEIAGDELGAGEAARILGSFYPGIRPDPRMSRDVYVSASWRPSDSASAWAVMRALAAEGFRLIGDTRDQPSFKTQRVEEIIRSCGAFVAILPLRSTRHEKDNDDYRHFLQEIRFAKAACLPMVVIADPRVENTLGSDTWIRMPTTATDPTDEVHAALQDLWTRWVTPPASHHIFLALRMEAATCSPWREARTLLEIVTGMPVLIGTDANRPPVQREIRRMVTTARLVIADLSADSDAPFSINACIEAGMALAADREVELVRVGETRRPPWMLRELQMPAYSSDADLVAEIHKIARRHRRRVINAEFS